MALSAVAFLVIAWVALGKAGDLSGDAIVGLVAALVSGVISIVVSAFSHLVQLRAATERRETRYEELVLKSLDYFTGQTQHRTVGIAIVEGAWDGATHLRKVFVPLLVNQAMYLLEQSPDDTYEQQNLDRILRIVADAYASKDFEDTMFLPLVGSLNRRKDTTSTGTGITIDSKAIDGWLALLPGGT